MASRAKALEALIVLARDFLEHPPGDTPEHLLPRLKIYVSQRDDLLGALEDDERSLNVEEKALAKEVLRLDAKVEDSLNDKRQGWGASLGEVKSRKRVLNGYKSATGARRTIHVRG
jgi:hypothetical protein